MKTPAHATLLLGNNQTYTIDKIHFATKQVTLQEKSKVYNTVSAKDVIFDFSSFTEAEIKKFKKALNE